jgi:hypothetical protein
MASPAIRGGISSVAAVGVTHGGVTAPLIAASAADCGISG